MGPAINVKNKLTPTTRIKDKFSTTISISICMSLLLLIKTVSNPSKTLDAIAYTVTSGSMIIDVTV